MYFPKVRKMLLKHGDKVFIFDPETVRIWTGDPDTEKILAMLEKGKSIQEMASELNKSENSVHDDVEDLRQKGILGTDERKKGPDIFSVNPLFQGIFALPLPSEILRKGAAYLARLSRQEGENEAVFCAKIKSSLEPGELDAVREILDEVSADSHTDILFSLVTSPQYMDNVSDARVDNVTVEVKTDEIPLFESVGLDPEMVSVRVAGEDQEDVRAVVSGAESSGLVNFQIPYRCVDVHTDFLSRLTFENFSKVPLSDKLVDLLVSILSRRPVREPHCAAGAKTFFCNSRGKIYPCELAQKEQFSMGTVADIHDHRDSSLSHSLRRHTQKACAECWTRNLCGGGCFLEQRTCPEFHHLTEHIIYAYPKIIGEMKERIAQSHSTDRLELIVDVLERIRQNYIFSWCKLR